MSEITLTGWQVAQSIVEPLRQYGAYAEALEPSAGADEAEPCSATRPPTRLDGLTLTLAPDSNDNDGALLSLPRHRCSIVAARELPRRAWAVRVGRGRRVKAASGASLWARLLRSCMGPRLGGAVEGAEGGGEGFGELVDVGRANGRGGRIFSVLPCGPVALISTRRSRRPLTTRIAASPSGWPVPGSTKSAATYRPAPRTAPMRGVPAAMSVSVSRR